jgi:hypothetical protein
MSFSRNRASYFPRPRLRSQTTTSIRRLVTGTSLSLTNRGHSATRNHTTTAKALAGFESKFAVRTGRGVRRTLASGPFGTRSRRVEQGNLLLPVESGLRRQP